MKINKKEDTKFEGIKTGLSLGEKTIAASAKEKLNVKSIDGKDESEMVHPKRYLKQREKTKWNRMSERKKKKYLKEGSRSIQNERTGIQNAEHIEQTMIGRSAYEKHHSGGTYQGKKQSSRRTASYKTTSEKNSKEPFFEEPQYEKSKKEVSWRQDQQSHPWKEPTVSLHTATSQGVKTGGEASAKAGAKGMAGASSGGVSFATDQAKKTAEKFRESLNTQNFQSKMEEIRNENREKQSAMQVGKYVGATAGLFFAPAIATIGTAVAVIASGFIIICMTIIAVLLPLIIIVTILSTILFGAEEKKEASSGYFGSKYYWIEYETGKTNDSAFATVLGDNGAAFGIQFDYRYTLQPFMNYCYESDPVAYSAFIPYLSVEKEFLKGNQGLADTWISIYNRNKEDFIELQKTYANDRYYVPAENRLEAAGIKITERSEVCQGAVLSFMFQGCRMGIVTAVSEAGITNETSDEEFIKKLYAYRREQYSRFTSRYEREEETALGLLNDGENLVVGDGYLCNPCPEAYISSEFGYRESPGGIGTTNHQGRDYAAASGTKIYAAQGGTVEKVAYNDARGNFLIINHGNGIKTLYQHCSTILVSEGTKVKQGDVIAKVGATGVVTGAHLHFEVWENGTPVDPRNYL